MTEQGQGSAAVGLDERELTGRARSHVIELEAPRCMLHREAAGPFLAMRDAAAAAGIDLQPVSSFRDFDRQLAIWNAKFRGERPVYDAAGCLLDCSGLDPEALIDTILLWSALPGASRHHWGSDVDVIDRAALPAGSEPQLLPWEFAPGGPFAPLDAWLRGNMGRFGFFRPYESFRGGVRPEPWHLSFEPVAGPALEALSVERLAAALGTSGLEGLELVLGRLPELHARYVRAIDPPAGVQRADQAFFR